MGWGTIGVVRAGGCSSVATPWVMAEQLQQSLALAMARLGCALPAEQPCRQCCSFSSGPGGLGATPQFQGCFPETPSAASSLLWACRRSICPVEGELLGTRTPLVISVSAPGTPRSGIGWLCSWDNGVLASEDDVCWKWCCYCVWLVLASLCSDYPSCP